MDTSAPSISSKVCCMSWCFQWGQDLSVSKWGSGMWENGFKRPSRTVTIQNDIQMIHTLDYTGLIPLFGRIPWSLIQMGWLRLDAWSRWAQGFDFPLRPRSQDCPGRLRLLWGVQKGCFKKKKPLKSWTCEAPVRNSESLKMKDICKIDWNIYWNILKYPWLHVEKRLQTFKFQTSFQIAASPAEDFNTVKVKWRNQSLSAADRNHPEPW